MARRKWIADRETYKLFAVPSPWKFHYNYGVFETGPARMAANLEWVYRAEFASFRVATFILNSSEGVWWTRVVDQRSSGSDGYGLLTPLPKSL